MLSPQKRIAGAFRGGTSQQTRGSTAASQEGDSLAQKRFGNAKAISSAQFQSDEDQKAADYEKQVIYLRELM